MVTKKIPQYKSDIFIVPELVEKTLKRSEFDYMPEITKIYLTKLPEGIIRVYRLYQNYAELVYDNCVNQKVLEVAVTKYLTHYMKSSYKRDNTFHKLVNRVVNDDEITTKIVSMCAHLSPLWTFKNIYHQIYLESSYATVVKR